MVLGPAAATTAADDARTRNGLLAGTWRISAARAGRLAIGLAALRRGCRHRRSCATRSRLAPACRWRRKIALQGFVALALDRADAGGVLGQLPNQIPRHADLVRLGRLAADREITRSAALVGSFSLPSGLPVRQPSRTSSACAAVTSWGEFGWVAARLAASSLKRVNCGDDDRPRRSQVTVLENALRSSRPVPSLPLAMIASSLVCSSLQAVSLAAASSTVLRACSASLACFSAAAFPQPPPQRLSRAPARPAASPPAPCARLPQPLPAGRPRRRPHGAHPLALLLGGSRAAPLRAFLAAASSACVARLLGSPRLPCRQPPSQPPLQPPCVRVRPAQPSAFASCALRSASAAFACRSASGGPARRSSSSRFLLQRLGRRRPRLLGRLRLAGAALVILALLLRGELGLRLGLALASSPAAARPHGRRAPCPRAPGSPASRDRCAAAR